MKLPDKVYDVLKWLCLVCIPAVTTFYVVTAPALGLPYADTVAKVSAALCTLIGSLIGISTAEYNKQ